MAEAEGQSAVTRAPTRDRDQVPLQLGGMALRDGVLLQSQRYWAAAVRADDGGISVSSRRKAQMPGRETLQRIPLARGLVRLGEALAVLPAVRRATGAPVLPQEDPRLLAASLGSAAASVALRRTGRGAPVARELAIAGVSLLPVFLALRDTKLSRYHGAEHKSVAAFEGGDAARDAAREHARCGTNLVLPLVVTNIATGLLLRAAGKERQPLATLVAGLVSLGTAMEVFSWMARHAEHPLAGALGRPGIELQRLFTTSEPSDEQLDVAHAALQELLRLEGRLALGEPLGAPRSRLFVPVLLLCRARRHAGHLDGSPVVAERHEHEVGRGAVRDDAGAQVFGLDADPHLHRLGAGVVHVGLERDEVAHLHRVVKVDAVYRGRDHERAAKLERAGARRLVDELHDDAAMDVAHVVGVGRHHE